MRDLLQRYLRHAVLISSLLFLSTATPPYATAVSSASLPTLTAGQTATMLADGRWLLLGGRTDGAISNGASIFDPRRGEQEALPITLTRARAAHTATTLPDGRILILGGIGSDGAIVRQAEVYDPAAARFQPLDDADLTPRAGHSAVTLTDGRVLIFGGVDGQGRPLNDAELWTAAEAKIVAIVHADSLNRRDALARLLPDGDVVFTAGTGVDHQPAGTAVRYRHETRQFDEISAAEAARETDAVDQASASRIVATLPQSGAEDFLPEGTLAVRFSAPVDVTTVTERTVFLIGPTGAVPSKVVPAEAGMLAFVTPSTSLFPGARYSIFLDGVVGARGVPLGFQAFDFGTATLTGTAPVPPPAASPIPAAPTPRPLPVPDERRRPAPVDDAVDDEIFVPDARHHGGRWRTGRAMALDMSQRMNQALADKGMLAYEQEYKKRRKPPTLKRKASSKRDTVGTAGGPGVAGQVLRLNDKPLSNVTVSIGAVSTRTDASGYFRLTGVPTGRQELFVDGTRAGNQKRQYAKFVIGVDVESGKTVDMPPIFLPRIRAQDWVPITSPLTQDQVVTHPNIPGMEIHIPKGAILRERNGKLVTQLALVPIPLDRMPFPFPENAPVYVSVQPGGLVVQGLTPQTNRGIRVIYPNLSNEPPGGEADFWRYDAAEKGWYVYGKGRASADAKHIVPNPGVAVYDSIGFMYTPPNSPPPPEDGPKRCDTFTGDPVSCSSGLFLHSRTDVTLSDLMPLDLTRTYRPGDNTSRPFGIGTSHPYAMNLYFPSTSTYDSAQLLLSDGGTVTFTRTSPGTDIASAVLESTNEPSTFYKARLAFLSATNSWRLTTKNGMTYEFANAAGLPLIALSDRYGNPITLTRVGGLIQRFTTAGGRYVDVTYDTNNRITKLLDHSGRAWTYTYDTAGRLADATDPDGNIERYTYDAAHRMLSVIDRRGNTMVTNQYDTAGRVLQQTLADGGIYRFAYTLDATNRISATTVTDPRGTVTRYDFNDTGHLTRRIIGDGTPIAQTTTYEREPGTNLLRATLDPLGRRTEYTYDAIGNTASITRLAGTPDAVTHTYTYEPTYNQIASHTDPLGLTSTFRYDPQGNLIETTDPLGHRTTLTYNTAGQPQSLTDPLNQTTRLAYDGPDLIAITDPLGRTTERFTDPLGRLAAITDPLGRRTRYTHDALDRVTHITDPLGHLTQLAYDANGNLTRVTDANGATTQFTYDAKNRRVQRTDPLLNTETVTYDGNDNTTQSTDRKGQGTTYTHDPLNRRTQIQYADATTTTYTYDAGNRPTQITDSVSGSTTRTYDGLDRIVTETTAQGSLAYTYDAANRRTGMTVTGQPSVSYTYDNAHRLTQITQDSATVQFTYDPANRRSTLTLPNGITATYTYDAAAQLTAITYQLGGTDLGNLTYAYDATGNRTTLGGTLAQTSLPPLLNTASHDAANRLLNRNGTNLTYDANGNLINNGTHTYTWDARNRLTQITGPTNASFQYDPLGRRIQKTVNGTTTNYLYDGINPVQEQTGTAQANLLTGLNVDEYFRRTDSNGSRDILTDALGSTLALTDSAGVIQTRYTHDPYGNTTTTGQASTNPFQYTGRENDNTGLYYYRARYYSPAYQRFVSEDPIGFGGGDWNLYGYVGNNPHRWIDPMGLAPSWVGPAGAVIGVTGGALAALGLATGNPIAAGLGLGLAAVGGGLTIWDWATTPLEQIEDAQKRLEPIKEDLRRIEELLEKERGDKIKPEGACR